MPDDEATRTIFTDLILETFRFNGRLLATGDILTGDLGLSSSRWQVLGALGLADRPLTVSQIARTMGITRQGVQRTVDILAEGGLLEFVDNPDHRRAKLLRLTPRGRALNDRIDKRQQRWAGSIVRDVNGRSLRTALAVLRKLRSRMEADDGVLEAVMKEKPHAEAG